MSLIEELAVMFRRMPYFCDVALKMKKASHFPSIPILKYKMLVMSCASAQADYKTREEDCGLPEMKSRNGTRLCARLWEKTDLHSIAVNEKITSVRHIFAQRIETATPVKFFFY